MTDPTYDEVCASLVKAERAHLLQVWRCHPIGQVYAAYRHAMAILNTRDGLPAPVHANPEFERLANLRPDEIAADLVARRVVSDLAEAARIVEEAASAALASREVACG